MGDRVREERNRLGYSQEVFAEMVGLSRDGVAKIEGNQSKARAETLYAISKATGKPMEYFVAGTYPSAVIGEVHEAADYVERTMAGLGEIARSLRRLGGKPVGIYQLDDMRSSSRRGQTSLAADGGLQYADPDIKRQAQDHIENTPDEPVNPGEEHEGTDLGDSPSDGG